MHFETLEQTPPGPHIYKKLLDAFIHMTLLIVYLTLAVVVSFFCSISEAVLLSVRPSYVTALIRKKKRGGRTLKKLRDNLDRSLAAILTANTIAHTIGAAGVGAQAAIVFGSQYLGIVSAILTFIILVFSEIIPKTLGATHWQKLAPTISILIDALTQLLLPFVWLSEKLTSLISRNKAHAYTFSRDEMEAMAEIGAKEGLLQSKETKIVRNLMRLHLLSVRDIMTPRPVVFSAQQDMTVKSFFDEHAKKPFSRIPIFGESTDDVIGYVLRSDLLTAQAHDRFDIPLKQFKRDFLVIPDMLNASDVFDRLVHEKSHIALVVDEYGAVQGLVTLEDILETLIGFEIIDELDTVEDMRSFAHQRWRERMKAMGIDPDTLIRPPIRE